MIAMSTGFDELDRRINELVEQEKECDDLFREILHHHTHTHNSTTKRATEFRRIKF
jgi:hypothetical protein